jgi:hypothetical protein
MAVNSLLVQHNVKFLKHYQRKEIIYSSRGGGLADFLHHFQDINSISEGLANVQHYIDIGTFDYERNTVSGELYTAWLDNETADIYPSTGNTELLLQSVPLSDFKVILMEWKRFLTHE